MAVRDALKASNELRKPAIDELFGDVYAQVPESLKEQERELKEHLRKYGQEYELENFKDGEKYPTQ